MSTKNQAIIERLVKIASKQQKILERLAQQQDPNIAYLQQAASVAAANSNINLTVPRDVQVTGSAAQYRVSVIVPAGTSNEEMDLFKRQYLNQIKVQKPQLAGKVLVDVAISSIRPSAVEKVGDPP